MEATVMPATAPVQKQQGLNQVVINKVRRMIEDRQGMSWTPSTVCSARDGSRRISSLPSG